MPKFVDDFVSDRLKDKSFYPELNDKERESIAFAIAYKQYNKKNKTKNKKKSFYIGYNNRYSNLLRLCSYLDCSGQFKKADKVIEALNRGEFWIDDYGSLTDADGDYGDYNHAMIAELEMLSRLGIYFNEEVYSLDDAKSIFENSLQNGEDDPEGVQEYLEDLKSDYGDDWELHADFDEFIIWKQSMNPTNHAANLINLNHTLQGFRDPVSFAVMNYGWTRAVIGSESSLFQTKILNKDTFEKIKQSLKDDYNEKEVIDPEYEIILEIQSPVNTTIKFEYKDFDWDHVWDTFKASLGINDPISGPNLRTPNMPEYYKGREGD
jgi:hypothetical protein